MLTLIMIGYITVEKDVSCFGKSYALLPSPINRHVTFSLYHTVPTFSLDHTVSKCVDVFLRTRLHSESRMTEEKASK